MAWLSRPRWLECSALLLVRNGVPANDSLDWTPIGDVNREKITLVRFEEYIIFPKFPLKFRRWRHRPFWPIVLRCHGTDRHPAPTQYHRCSPLTPDKDRLYPYHLVGYSKTPAKPRPTHLRPPRRTLAPPAPTVPGPRTTVGNYRSSCLT
jgi:hypothetical protein